MCKKAYIIFSKIPAAGFSKTRLSISVGEQIATNIQTEMLYHIIKEALLLKDISVYLAYSAREKDDPHLFLSKLPNRIKTFAQTKGDLGLSMAQAIITVQNQGYDQVVLSGSDLPDLNAGLIKSAFTRLKNCDVILGPTVDGGFYLIGTSGPQLTTVLMNKKKSWGTNSILSSVKQSVAASNLTLSELEELIDIDTIDDLNNVRRH